MAALENGDPRLGMDIGYDPLDLSAAFAEQAREGAAGEDDEQGGKKRRVMAKVDIER